MTGILILVAYIALFTVGWLAVRTIRNAMTPVDDFNARKTVTFGDESAVMPDRWASIISVVVLFLIWGAFTGSKIAPFHVPGPFTGETSFTYTLEAPMARRTRGRFSSMSWALARMMPIQRSSRAKALPRMMVLARRRVVPRRSFSTETMR